MFSLIKWIFGSAQQRLLKRYDKRVEQVNARFKEIETLSKQELRDKTQELKNRIKEGASLDSLLVEAYAMVKVMCLRSCGESVNVMGETLTWEIVPYDVQLLGACALHEGGCTQMQTGEGKTFTAILPLFLNALKGPCHLVTVNDYLAQRDCEWAGYILRELGLTTGYLTNAMAPVERREVYGCDIVYGTASEFGFDYLRDNSMASSPLEQVQRSHYYAIIDEADSVLIDEARTPLIISGPSPVSRHKYTEVKNPVATLIKKQREISTQLASEARKTLESLGALASDGAIDTLKLSKQESEELEEAIDKLWRVTKSTPRHKMVKKLKEDPSIRKRIDDRDLFYYSEANKELREHSLSQQLITVDEKRNDYELTEQGIEVWIDVSSSDGSDHASDFVMMNLGDEFLKIDEMSDISDDERMQKRLEIQRLDEERKERSHNIRQLLRAHLMMERDVDYIIDGEKIVIIDENTGRPQPGRRFSDGLHQAIEAKEGVEIQHETQTYAQITLQNYFRLYEKRSGMSGTCITEAKEFKEIYQMEVIEIPTHLPCKRIDAIDLVYITEREKYQALLKEVKEIHAQGRPILVGTESVEISEKLARIFKANKLPHTILNAKNHAREAQIVAMAGQKGSITISTNMAGRGTDIKLGEGVRELGGLHVIGTTRHSSRRIDRQLRGRCSRQGDPGSSQFYVSFEDQLMRLFANERMNSIIQRYRPEEGEPITSSMLTSAIESAQKRVEQHHYSMRKHTLEYDNVMNVQRQEIYSFRNELLHTDESIKLCSEFINDSVEALYEHDQSTFFESITQTFPVPDLPHSDQRATPDHVRAVQDHLQQQWELKLQHQREKFKDFPPLDPHFLEKTLIHIMLMRLDHLWKLHLARMDQVRSDVQLRALGQKDPLMEYKEEAFVLFEELNITLRRGVCRDLFAFDLIPSSENEETQHAQSSQMP